MTPFDIDTLRAQEPQLRRLARAIVGDAYADDIVQATWAAALDRGGEAPRNWGAWLNRVTRNLAWRQRNGAQNEHARAVDVFDADKEEQGADEVVAHIEEKHVLERAILELEEPYRSALLWRYYKDLSVEEISRRAGTVPSTTRSHLQRGLDRLRARLESEKGADWRLALVPFLRPPQLAAKAAVVAGASGVGLLTAYKMMFVAALAAMFLAFQLVRIHGVDGRGEDLARLAPSADLVQIPEKVDMPLKDPAVSPTLARLAAAEGTATPSEETRGAAPAGSTVLQLVDFKSGVPLPGVTFEAHHTLTKGKFFFKQQTDVSTILATDDAGRATLPVDVDGEGAVDGNQIYAVVDPSPTGGAGGRDRTEHVSVLKTLDDGTVQLSANPAAAFWIRLPDSLTPTEIGALDARLTVDLLGQVSNLGSPFAPLAVHGSDLLFLVPHVVEILGWDDQEKATLHIATTDKGPSFRAELERNVSLADAPIMAERSTETVQRFRVLDDTTGKAVEGATVLLKSQDKWNPSHFDAARTDAGGHARLFGIPEAPLILEVRMDGYELLTDARNLTQMESLEVRLRKKNDLRKVRVTLRSTKGRPVSSIHLFAYDMETQGPLERARQIKARRKGQGWEGTIVLEHISARPVFLELSFPGGSYAPMGPIRVASNQGELTIDVGNEIPTRSLVLRLPAGVEAVYRQRTGDGPEYTHRGLFTDGSTVTSVAVDGRPIHWVIEAPGYVPMKGTELDFYEGTRSGRPCMELQPQLVEGEGLLLSAALWPRQGEVPPAFYRSTPLAGVQFTLVETGVVLGTTDASGHLAIPRNGLLGKIAATYEGTTHVTACTGEHSSLSFAF